MNRRKSNLYIGGIIVLIGILALLSNTNILSGLDDLAGGAFLLLISFVFYSIYNKDRSKWWPLLPATILAVLGVGLMLEIFFPFADDLLGAGILFAIFTVFAYVYTREPSNWWAVIPAGVCFTLGVVILVDSFRIIDSDMSGVVFFLGLGLTFYYLWSLRHEKKDLSWAVWPAVVLLFLAAVTYIEEVNWLGDEYIFPLLLILGGVVIIVNGTRKNKKS